MGKNTKISIGLISVLVIISMIALPGQVAAVTNPTSTGNMFWGTVCYAYTTLPSDLIVRAYLKNIDAGPWNAEVFFEGGFCWYRVTVPEDNPATPDIEGGKEGDTVILYAFGNGDGLLLERPIDYWHKGEITAHNLDLILPPLILGDADEDGRVGIGDILYTELVMLQQKPYTEGSDVNQDGRVSIADILLMELIMIGLYP
jgi:hypothetical protein